jgi:hypothetical protein
LYHQTGLNKGLIVKIPTKEDRAVCDNYKCITLLSTLSKVFSKIIVQRIQRGVEKRLIEEQAGKFRQGRNNIEQLFTLRNIIVKYAEWNKTRQLYLNQSWCPNNDHVNQI